jgi:hypothetical protein
MRTSTKIGLVAVAVLTLAAGGWAALAAGGATPAPEPSLIGPPDDAPGGGSDVGGGMAMCIEGVPDCDDMVVIPGGDDPVGDDTGDDPLIDPVPDAQVVEPNPDAVDLRARPFDAASVGDDGRTVTIDFVSGVEPCYVLGRIDVDEGPNAVRITLFEGHLPSDEDVACIDLGVFKTTTITLDTPLGDREIVDGAA